MLMFNWIQAIDSGADIQLRIIGTKVEIVVDYLGADARLGAQSFWIEWPIPTNPAAVGRYDQNAGAPYTPRLIFNPPDGTKRVGVHVNFMVHTPYKDGFGMINAAIDDFFLAPTGKREKQI